MISLRTITVISIALIFSACQGDYRKLQEAVKSKSGDGITEEKEINEIEEQGVNKRIVTRFEEHLQFIGQPLQLEYDSAWDTDRRRPEGQVRLSYIYSWYQPETFIFSRIGEEMSLIRTQLDTAWEGDILIQTPRTDTLILTDNDYSDLIGLTEKTDIWYYEEFAVRPYLIDATYLLMEVNLGLGVDKLYMSSPEENVAIEKIRVKLYELYNSKYPQN